MKNLEMKEYQTNCYDITLSKASKEDLGDIDYIDVRTKGLVRMEDVLMTIEASKASIEISSDFDGEILEVNQEVIENPSLLNKEDSPNYWIIKVRK